MKLYHGSSMSVENPLAEIGRNNLDFGKGFYTTRLKEQAQKWGGLVASRKSPDAVGVVSTYEWSGSILSFPAAKERMIRNMILLKVE